MSLLPFNGLSWGSTGNGSGRLSARGHGENPGYAGFCGVPDIPSNPHHSPVIPVDGPNTTNARPSFRAFMVCVGYECSVHVATTPHGPSRHYHLFPPSKKSPARDTPPFPAFCDVAVTKFTHAASEIEPKRSGTRRQQRPKGKSNTTTSTWPIIP